MADENINSKEALQGLANINLELKNLNANLKSKDSLNTVGNLRKAIRDESLSSEDEQKVLSKQGLMDLGYEEQDAELRVAANTELKRLREEQDKEKEIEYIKIREWEERFDREQKQKEQEEMKREQRLIQKEMERRAKFDNLDDNTESSLSQLEKFNIDKSKEN